MRYPDGGGLTGRERARREAVRMQAADWFERGVGACEVARGLRVSTKSAYAWRRLWRAGGRQALRSRGPGGPDCRLDRARLDRLVQALEQGPAAHGYTEDRRWTLARVAELVARLFAVRYTPAGMSLVLHRIGYSPQVPARRADRRDEAAVTAWRRESWARGKP